MSSKKFSDKDALGQRCKKYEKAFRGVLPERLPVIIRLDGKGFSKLTKGLDRPFDDKFIDLMNRTAQYVCEQLGDAVFAYIQSDEISILVHGYRERDSTPVFDNQIQKIVSIVAGMASGFFTAHSAEVFGTIKIACFDARVFVVPEWEVNNVFWWRQADNIRNSVQMLARSLYSHSQLDKKNGLQLKEMCAEKGKVWDDLPVRYRHGRCLYKKKTEIVGLDKKTGESQTSFRSKWTLDDSPPLFSKEKSFVETHILRSVVNPAPDVLDVVGGEAHETHTTSNVNDPTQNP